MFTNWLTGTTGGGTPRNDHTNGNSAPSSSNNSTANAASNNTETAVLPATVGSVAAAAAAAAAASSVASSIMTTPPDVVLEVGPPGPASARFVAHSIVLGMHSGYLRSAIRLDENAGIAGTGNELILYLGNVTAEQFAPLLTYMYTGYLDLNVENIFGVLLATHVLHMPRALEICRSFLARAQTEGYLASNSMGGQPPIAANSSSKIIRPIPSKPTVPSFGFLPLTATHQLPLPQAALAANTNDTFKQLQQAYGSGPLLAAHNRCGAESRASNSTEIDVDREPSARNSHVDDDDEDVEVFIDNNTDSDFDGELDCAISVTSHSSQQPASCKNKQPHESSTEREIVITVAEPPVPLAKARAERDREITRAARSKPAAAIGNTSTPNTSKRERRKQTRTHHHKSGGSRASGLQVAKAPIPASQLDNNESSKVIIDVASCDGPVRFRRILNTAYGHKPEDYAVMPERTQQSVSLSFHQQMAKAISQQRQLVTANEESENSESSGGGGGGNSAGASGSSGKHSKNASNEIYVCVYCKHTFKSQYCYQKHAKRHLNPLSLNCAAAAAAAAANLGGGPDVDEKITASAKSAAGGGGGGANGGFNLTQSIGVALPIVTSKQGASELLRREVRPLDMNVQYYPCKTCGSKFPSYYFVHKHRKMCHAEEEAAAAVEAASKRGESGGANGGGGNGGAASGIGESKREKATEKKIVD
ncbi:uncharacterized protein LOC118748934 [Rhagoletis pomonella]|uniref:uncharacterized protein LOC118748934 n=1 Tax=Rhagoletis pomonella TaxID=28610 RepID=UPI001781A303|nr:uncharacterized protein LOC118748934 [Rhagoletis pomonella]